MHDRWKDTSHRTLTYCCKWFKFMNIPRKHSRPGTSKTFTYQISKPVWKFDVFVTMNLWYNSVKKQTRCNNSNLLTNCYCCISWLFTLPFGSVTLNSIYLLLLFIVKYSFVLLIAYSSVKDYFEQKAEGIEAGQRDTQPKITYKVGLCKNLNQHQVTSQLFQNVVCSSKMVYNWTYKSRLFFIAWINVNRTNISKWILILMLHSLWHL